MSEACRWRASGSMPRWKLATMSRSAATALIRKSVAFRFASNRPRFAARLRSTSASRGSSCGTPIICRLTMSRRSAASDTTMWYSTCGRLPAV
jgi:hypothetical protein